VVGGGAGWINLFREQDEAATGDESRARGAAGEYHSTQARSVWGGTPVPRFASLAVSLPTTSFKIKKFYVLPTLCIYVFCVDLTTNSDYFPIQHYLTGLYKPDGVCLLRGTDWIFK
jgi:hypothetical protein